MREMIVWVFIFSVLNKMESLATGITNADLPGSIALDRFPLIDGHNDLPNNMYELLNNSLKDFHFEKNLKNDPIFGSTKSSHTDLPRLRKGKIGAQFWVAYVNCKNDKQKEVSRTLDQIDVIKRFIRKYSEDLEYVTTADGILEAFNRKKIASLIAVEGGHSIDSKMSILRIFYELGARYLTLTHMCNLPWADSSVADQTNSSSVGLSDFGKKIVLEMNRLGMMVDLSHVSYNVMNDAIDVSRAPVIFSHSSAYAIHKHARNVQDDVLKKVAKNQGIVMVNFYNTFVAEENATIKDIVNHINHIVDVAGIDHVGIGSDYDGVNLTPVGLEDVSKYPDLFDLLKNLNPQRWTIENLEKLAGRNFIRVFKEVEKVKEKLSTEEASEYLLENF